MSLNISTNTAALRAGSYLSQNNALLQRSFDRLASGKKLLSPVEDPGGLAVSMKSVLSINRSLVLKTMCKMPFLPGGAGRHARYSGQIIDRMSELKGSCQSGPDEECQDRQVTITSSRTCRYNLRHFQQGV